MKSQKLLRIREAANLLGVSVMTLRRWDNSGKLKAIKVSSRGDRRYSLEDVEAFIKENKK